MTDTAEPLHLGEHLAPSADAGASRTSSLLLVCGTGGQFDRDSESPVSGKNGGYYGCLAATKGACDNKTLVRRRLAEKIILVPSRTRSPIPNRSPTS
jgi:hypothetical protein